MKVENRGYPKKLISFESAVSSHRSWILLELLCKKKRGIALADCEEQEFDQPMYSCSCYHFFYAVCFNDFTIHGNLETA